MGARKSDPVTSKVAARISRSKKRDVAAVVLAELRQRKRGLADFQLERIVTARTGVTPQRVRTIRAELTRPPGIDWGLLTGERYPVVPVRGEFRLTPTGRRAQVYKAVS